MTMLIFETFLLMFASALFGIALGRLLGEAFGSDEPADRPWLRDLRPLSAAPTLPALPTLLSDDERLRLTAATVAPPPVAAPAEVAVEPAPTVAPASASLEPADAAGPVLSAEDAARAAAADAVGARPVGLAAPREGRADDLKRIKGIGRQNEARLHALGIWHFSQIAAWTPENVRWAGSFLAFAGRIEREDWVAQAAVLAAGGTTDFAARVDAGEVPTSSA